MKFILKFIQLYGSFRSRSPIPIIFLLLLLPAHALTGAQQPGEDITGRVLDPGGRAVPRALVILQTRAGEEVSRALSGPRGRFRLESTAGERYRLVVELTGFVRFEQEVTAGADVEVSLQLAPVEERVLVTATRTGTPSSQLGVSSTVFAEEEIGRRQEVQASDLLRSMPGAIVVTSGGYGTTTSLFIRGGEANHTKVLLDGVPLNGPGGDFSFANLSLENIEQVEVVRGPQSALFGSDAMSGVVQLFSKRSPAETVRPNLFVSFEGGNQDTYRGRAGLSGGRGAFDYSAQWARLNTDNREPNNNFHNTSLSGSFGFQFRDSTSLRAVLQSDFGHVGIPGATAFSPPDLDADARRRQGLAGLTLHDQTTEHWDQRFTYGFSRSREVSRNLQPVTEFLFDSLNDQKRYTAGYQTNLRAGPPAGRAGRHELTFGFDWDGERGRLGDRLLPASVGSHERDNFGWVFQDQVLWSRFSLAAGVRLENNDSFGFAAAPRVSAAVFPRLGGGALGGTKLKFNFGLGIKEPTFLESFSQNPFFLGNPDLQEERVRSFDTGVEQRFWHDRGKFEVNLFHNRFRDLIEFGFSSDPNIVGNFFNVRRAKAKGSEVVLQLAPIQGLRGRGTYTFLDSKSFDTERPLLRRPKHSGTFDLFWDWRRLTVTSTTLIVGKREDFGGANAGYVRSDLSLQIRAGYRTTYFLAVENLLNDDYQEALGFPALKLMFRAGARVNF